ncbi:MAG TPA: serine hydrolase domain-containing protein [bacterium]|nr:serine hydrolase domain-containing protein [bacterium]
MKNNKIKRVTENIMVETHLKNYFKRVTLEERMNQLNAPGVSITVVNNGQIEWSNGFGLKNLSTGEKVRNDTIFLAGSVSKPVFALAVMKLVERGKIDLDRDVNEYLKSWKIPENGAWQAEITMRQLLSHTAGLTVHGFGGYNQSSPVPTTKQILNGENPANSYPVVPYILPGTMFKYSGGGVTVAQFVVEELFDKPFPEIMDEILFKPLNLENSTYNQNLSQKQKEKAASGYYFNIRPVENGYHLYPEMAAAGLWTNGEDLAKIMIEVQSALKGESLFFKKETVEEMLTVQKGTDDMGIGFFLEGESDSQRFFHAGWDEGFVTKFISGKQDGNGVIVFINSNEGVGLLDEIVRSVANAYEWSEFNKDLHFAEEIDEKILDAYCGVYCDEKGLEFKISKSTDKLLLELPGQKPLDVLSETFSFFDFKISFKTSETGEQIMTLVQDGNVITAKKDENNLK